MKKFSRTEFLIVLKISGPSKSQAFEDFRINTISLSNGKAKKVLNPLKKITTDKFVI